MVYFFEENQDHEKIFLGHSIQIILSRHMRLKLSYLKISGHCSWILNYVTDLWNSGSSVNVVLNTNVSNAKNTRDNLRVIIRVRSLCEALEVDPRDLQGVSVCSWILVHRNKTFRPPEALRCERSESTCMSNEAASIIVFRAIHWTIGTLIM